METSLSIAPLLTILIIAGLAAFGYYKYYKSRINKALEDGNDTETSAPEPASVTRIALLMVLVIIMMSMSFRISSLRTHLSSIENKLNNIQQQVYSQQNILNDISKKLDQQASMIESYSVSYGAFDVDTHSAELFFTVTPKETDENSMLAITVGKQTAILQKTAQGSFTGNLRVDIFENTNADAAPRLIITKNGTSRSETFGISDLSDLWHRYLPDITCTGLHSEQKTEDGMKVISAKGELHLDLFSKNNVSEFMKGSIRMYTEIGGKITEDKDLSSDVVWDKGHGVVHTPVELSASIRPDEKVRILVSAKDNNGYSYEYTIFSTEESESGRMKIFDAAGNQLN